jgi:MoaA/NifB/PqqE/SkfB family radical SAM enzyme
MKAYSAPLVKLLRVMSKNFLSRSPIYPYFGTIETTARCNSRCGFCPYSHYDFTDYSELTTEQVYHIIDQFHEIGICGYSFLGAENTLRSDTPDIGRYLRKKEIIAQLCTNGILLEKQAEELVSSVDCIMVSLDTIDREKYKAIRGVDALPQVVRGLKAALKHAQGNGCAVITNTVICSPNLDEIPDIVRFAYDELGIHGMLFDQVTLPESWTSVDKTMDSKLCWDKHVRAIQQIKELKKQGYPILTSSSYLNTLMDPQIPFRSRPYLWVTVNHKGEVAIPCYDSGNTKFVSLLENNLKDVWLSKETQELRKKVRGCHKCHMMCTIEISKVVGEPYRHPRDLFEWIVNAMSLSKQKN